MKKKSRSVLIISIILVLFSVSFFAKSRISLAATISGVRLAQFQEQITKIRAQIQEIKTLIEIKNLKKEIDEKEDLMEKVRMYGLTLHQTIPDIILQGLYPFKVVEESSTTTTATDTVATTTLAEASTTASSTEEVASEATTTELITTGGGLGEGIIPVPELEPEPEPEPPPVVCTSVPSGTITYSVSTKANPKMTQVVISPLDVEKFSSQAVRATIQETNDNPITNVSGTAFLDNVSIPFTLYLISGTETSGTWQGSWVNSDSYCKTYMMRITATSASGQSNVELSFK